MQKVGQFLLQINNIKATECSMRVFFCFFLPLPSVLVPSEEPTGCAKFLAIKAIGPVAEIRAFSFPAIP
jgi:hypothetical protein